MSASSAAFFCENFAGTVSVAGASGTANAPLTNAAFCCGWVPGACAPASAGGVDCWAAASPTLPTTASASVLVPKKLRMVGSCPDEQHLSAAAWGRERRNHPLVRAAAAVGPQTQPPDPSFGFMDGRSAGR